MFKIPESNCAKNAKNAKKKKKLKKPKKAQKKIKIKIKKSGFLKSFKNVQITFYSFFFTIPK